MSLDIYNKDPSLDDERFEKDHHVEEISRCISHLSLDLRTEEESKGNLDTLSSGCEGLTIKNKHKNRRKRSLRHIDCILKDVNGTFKHYDSLCSSYLFKTRIFNVFEKNEYKENLESIQRELRTRSNIQKIANGVKTCILQSFNIGVPGNMHPTHSALIEEGPYIPPNERKNLLNLQSSCIPKYIFGKPHESNLSFVKLDIQPQRITCDEEIQRNTVRRLFEDDPMSKQIGPLDQNSASIRTRKKRNGKKNSKALSSYRSEQDGSYSTEDTDTEDHPPQNVLSKKKTPKAKDFAFAKNKIGWASEDSLRQQHHGSEENSSLEEGSVDVCIRPSSLTCLDNAENTANLPLYSFGIRQQQGEKYFDAQEKEDELIVKETRNKRSGKRKRISKKIPKVPQLYISEREDSTIDTDTEGSPQKKISSKIYQNQIRAYDDRTPHMSRKEDVDDDIEKYLIYNDGEMLNTELPFSQSSLVNFSSENYNLQFPKCSSFVLIMGNQLGKHSGISSSMETLCSTNEREPLTENSRNEMLQDISQKMEGVSLNDQIGQEAAGLSMEGDHQVAMPEDRNDVECEKVFNFSAGGLRFDFTPSLQLKAKKIVYKKNRNMRRFLFRSNKEALYLKTIS